MGRIWKTELMPAAVFIILYVLIGNARSIQPNPLIPGATIAVNMMVPVLGGILFGWRTGLAVGIVGTFLNAISPAGNEFEFLAIAPHGVMGFAAGFFRKNFPTPILALSLVAGHLLNIIIFALTGLLPRVSLLQFQFWYGLAFESFAGIITIIILASIYRLATQTIPRT